MFVVCCVGSGLCDELITHSEEFYHACVCVCVCVCVWVCVPLHPPLSLSLIVFNLEA